jgi:hypothetical protein
MITSIETLNTHGMPVIVYKATEKAGGSLLDLRCRWFLLGRSNFFTRPLAGLNQSGLHTKLRQNNCLKQKPDDHHHNY